MSWLALFLLLALTAVALLCPWLVFEPAHYRQVADGDGQEVKVPVPPRGVVSVWRWTPFFLPPYPIDLVPFVIRWMAGDRALPAPRTRLRDLMARLLRKDQVSPQ